MEVPKNQDVPKGSRREAGGRHPGLHHHRLHQVGQHTSKNIRLLELYFMLRINSDKSGQTIETNRDNRETRFFSVSEKTLKLRERVRMTTIKVKYDAQLLWVANFVNEIAAIPLCNELQHEV